MAAPRKSKRSPRVSTPKKVVSIISNLNAPSVTQPSPKTVITETVGRGYSELDQRRVEIGKLGFFGGEFNAPYTIAGIAVIMLLGAGIAAIFVGHEQTTQIWRDVLPIVSMTIGYLFGKKRNTSK